MDRTRISHYEVGRRLGRGGMGEVYEAVDLDLGRPVALKFVAPELAADAATLRRFEREARSAAALNHPHIATLYAFERDGDSSFIAMELVTGGSVRDRLADGPLPVAEAVAIARDIAGALALAHRRGIVHRDVKPENLMFDGDDIVKLMDFGLARAAQASRMTMTGSTLGTAAYMPPESVQEGAEAPGDVFALGVTLYEMLTGRLPFAGDTPLALLYSIANAEPEPLGPARPDAPPQVGALIGRMLAKPASERPDAATVARELSGLAGLAPPTGEPVTEELIPERTRPPDLPGPASPVPAAGGAIVPRARERRRPSRRLAAAAFAALVFVALLVLLLPGALRARDARRQQAATRLTDQGVDSLTAGNEAAAQDLFEAALRRDPGHGKAAISLGRTLHARGDDARAAEVLRAALARHGEDREIAAMARDALADIDMARGNWAGAVASLRRAFALDSSTARAYNQLAYALVRGGRPHDGIDLLTRAIPRFPGEPALHKNLGLGALVTGDPRTAVAEADRALALDPGYAAALSLRARARSRLGDRAGALADWGRFLALRPAPADSAETAADLAGRGLLP